MIRNNLTTQVKGNSRCLRCDVPLNASTWKGVVVAIALTSKKNTPYYCVRCVKLSKGKRYRTDEELDNFVSSLMVMS